MRSALRRLRSQIPVPVDEARLYRPSRLTAAGGGQEALMRAYGVMGTVHSCVSLLAEAVGRAEWRMYRKPARDGRVRYSTTDNGSDQRTEVFQHAAMALVNRPNDFYTRSRLFELDQSYMELTGESYWVLARDGGASFPTQIWPVRPDRMDPVPDPDRYLLGWIYTSPDGEKIPLDVDQVIQTVYPNPLDPMHGLGPVQSILVDIDSSKYSADWNRNFFINSARPDGFVQIPGSWDDKEWNNFSNRWRETHRGVSRAHRVAILEDGAAWVPNQFSAKDMDFAALRNLSRDIVREAFRMHKVMIGVSDDVNRANAQTGEEVFASWGVVPRLERKRDTLNNVLLPMFGSTGEGVEFDFVAPVPTNREEDRLEMVAKAQAAQMLVNAGYDPHAVLEVIGLPDMEVAERATQQPALPPQWVPGAAPGAAPGTPPQGQDGPDEMTARLRRMLSNGHLPVATGRR